MAKILLIDDDAKLRHFLQGALEERGHSVACLERAEGGADVLATGEFDLVLVDEHMPGLSGSEFLKVLRRQGLGIPAILMTGYAKGDILQAAKKLDAFVVGKPSGGYDEFWKELEPLLADALQGEAEILTSLRRAIDAALKAGKTNLVPRLRKFLDQELLTRALAVANGDQSEATRILGVPLAQLVRDDQLPGGANSRARALSFHAEALLLIHNHPEWTAAEIAQQLGCSKAKLYRDPIINRALKGRNVGHRPPMGFKDADGDVDAFDE
jgi:DNA-binding NtrC family response regulator